MLTSRNFVAATIPEPKQLYETSTGISHLVEYLGQLELSLTAAVSVILSEKNRST